MTDSKSNVIATNRKARHDFHIEESFEVGIVLTGTEVKSMRAHKVNLKDSHAGVRKDEVFLYNMHVSPYEQGTTHAHDPERPRKLLLHRHEIRRLIGKTRERGLTLIPLKLYFKGSKVKVELGLARGKQLHDKRKTMADRDAKREIERAFRDRQKS